MDVAMCTVRGMNMLRCDELELELERWSEISFDSSMDSMSQSESSSESERGSKYLLNF